MKKTEREELKMKLVKLQKEWTRIRQASADASNRIIGLKDFVKNRHNARKTGGGENIRGSLSVIEGTLRPTTKAKNPGGRSAGRRPS